MGAKASVVLRRTGWWEEGIPPSLRRQPPTGGARPLALGTVTPAPGVGGRTCAGERRCQGPAPKSGTAPPQVDARLAHDGWLRCTARPPLLAHALRHAAGSLQSGRVTPAGAICIC